MKVKRTLILLVVLIAVLVAAASVNGGMFDGHRSAGWTWDRQVAADDTAGFSDGNS